MAVSKIVPPPDASEVIYNNTNVKLALDGLSSDKLNKSGGTMSGSLSVQVSGNAYVKVTNTDKSVDATLNSAVNGQHGLYSNGYNDGTFHESAKWLINRQADGSTMINGNVEVPSQTGTLALTSDLDDKMCFKFFTSHDSDARYYYITLDKISQTRFPFLILSHSQSGYLETIGCSVNNTSGLNKIYFSSQNATYDESTKVISVNTVKYGWAEPMIIYPKGFLTFAT